MVAVERITETERELEFTDLISWSGHQQLACPNCGDGYLHHDMVDVFERFRYEDGDSLRFRVNGTHTETTLIAEADAPGRRNSIEIRFYCENCAWDEHGQPQQVFYVLQIIQHKGCTYLSWVREIENVNLKPVGD